MHTVVAERRPCLVQLPVIVEQHNIAFGAFTRIVSHLVPCTYSVKFGAGIGDNGSITFVSYQPYYYTDKNDSPHHIVFYRGQIAHEI